MDGPAVDNSTDPFLRFWEKTQDGLTSSVWLSREDLHLLAAQASRRLVESLGGCMQKEQGNYSVSQLAENHTEQRQQKQGKQQTRAGAGTEGIEGQTTNRTGLLKPLRGVCIAHYMTKNRVEEVILRLAAKASGYIPVTINWDADGIDRILYKIESTHCQAVIVDEEVPVACLNRLAEAAQGRFKVLSAKALCFQSHDNLPVPEKQSCENARSMQDCDLRTLSGGKSECTPSKEEREDNVSLVRSVRTPRNAHCRHREKNEVGEKRQDSEDSEGELEKEKSTGKQTPEGESRGPISVYLFTHHIWKCIQRMHLLTYRYVVFTSGTTGRPKGAILTNKNMETSCLALRQLLDLRDDTPLTLVIVNPLHHVNSSVMLELALRSRRAKVHLVSRYTTSFWRLLADVAEEEAAASGRPERSAVPKRDFRLLTPLVSRHIDFLRELVDTNRLTGVSVHRLAHALKPKEVVLLLGSAPVGLTTVQTFLRLLGKLPAIRFGSTETCLQVSPTHFSRPRYICSLRS
ncbi:AMP-binding enzyme [Toxoplasma gondii FOU]|uniref:AMP-binding enzyme n=1 Tax=Toxoplasma gondii FOU TaxID=943167 RepID=A0A086JYZ1_TOXGO|nr:AMP-binding enzyme [Toxoplasma gondii FOU]